MIAFFVCGALLFFSMFCSYSWYTWYLRLDVIGVGWFSDEDVRDTEEYRYRQVLMVNFDFHNMRFGFGVIDNQDQELELEHEQGIEGNTPRTKELVDRGLAEIYSSSCELVELSFEINGVNHTINNPV